MSLNKSPKIIKYCVISSTAALFLILITLIPIAKKSNQWNVCLNNTVKWINQNEKNLEEWDKPSKTSLAVAVCNGAVYEVKHKK